MTQKPYIRWFNEVTMGDTLSVGGKNASLGEMVQALAPLGVQVPNGFAITVEGYWDFINGASLDKIILENLNSLNPHDINSLREHGRRIRQAILAAELPKPLQAEIERAYKALSLEAGVDSLDVAVRSSATAEDLPQASFAGQQETYLNVRGLSSLLDSCKRCFASLFTDRAISYRQDMNFDHFKVALSIGVQQMVRSDLAAAGVIFSIDTETGFKDAALINASYGLGENVVQGSINPDEYTVFKPTLKEGYRPILKKRVGGKEFKLIYDIGGEKMVKNVPVPPDEREVFALNDEEILKLARWATLIEEHYSQKKRALTPMDIEWAKDGRTGQLFIVQARPETVQSLKKSETIEIYELKEKGQILTSGRSIGEKISRGQVQIIKNVQQLDHFRAGNVLVTEKTDPDWEPMMKKASGIVTNRGGRTCHAAIVARELGIPAIVGTENGTEILKNGQEVTVSCAEGDVGYIYFGRLSFEKKTHRLSEMSPPMTKIMMNVANPEEAFRLSFYPNDGVGLARVEFIISGSIKVHPMALVHFNALSDSPEKEKIKSLTRHYSDKTLFFVDELAQGVAMIAAAFYPKDVIVRMSDFKTNEYANLVGGQQFEPKEENPMIGFRGASRYYDKRYQEGFKLECMAMKKVRHEMGLKNLKLMIPFCRTLKEASRVLLELEQNGLKRGDDKLEIYMMSEIPSNVILAKDFAQFFDGFSIGSNDLTQLVLGIDRDSEVISHLFDERDPAVKSMISNLIRDAKDKGIKIGICGQAPSDYPEFAEFLVQEGIDSISLSPDVVLKTHLKILEVEKDLLKKKKKKSAA
jgi:pyruvate, water dikinase